MPEQGNQTDLVEESRTNQLALEAVLSDLECGILSTSEADTQVRLLFEGRYITFHGYLDGAARADDGKMVQFNDVETHPAWTGSDRVYHCQSAQLRLTPEGKLCPHLRVAGSAGPGSSRVVYDTFLNGPRNRSIIGWQYVDAA